MVCTTDDPCDELLFHQRMGSADSDLRMYPTFRPDRSLQVDQPPRFAPWVHRLEQVCNKEIATLPELLDALKERHDAFHEVGGRLSDHGLPYCFVTPCTETEAGRIFERALSGNAASKEQHEQFASFMMLFFGHLMPKKAGLNSSTWALCAPRTRVNCANSALTPALTISATGRRQSGCARTLTCSTGRTLCQRWSSTISIRQMIMYSQLRPAVFRKAPVAAKIQFGSGWWFLDQKEGMELQLNALSNVGLLSRFIGMVTDSRSFMSFPRHEYFRRVLCNLLGDDIGKGELPNDMELIGDMVRNICFANARDYLGLELPRVEASATKS